MAHALYAFANVFFVHSCKSYVFIKTLPERNLPLFFSIFITNSRSYRHKFLSEEEGKYICQWFLMTIKTWWCIERFYTPHFMCINNPCFIFNIFNWDIYLNGFQLWLSIVLNMFTSLNWNYQMHEEQKYYHPWVENTWPINITYWDPSSNH